MVLTNDIEFGILGVGAIIEKTIAGIPHILLQNRIRVDDCTQNHLIEVPCGKVRKKQSIFDVLHYRVKQETGLVVTEIVGQEGIFDSHPNYLIQSGSPFHLSQNIDEKFPVCILFFICKADAGEKMSDSEAATDIRWVSIDDLAHMLQDEKSNFFPFVCEALEKYIHYKQSAATK